MRVEFASYLTMRLCSGPTEALELHGLLEWPDEP
jgi:hypothetical protein